MKTRREFMKVIGQGAAGGMLLRAIPAGLGRSLLRRGAPVGLGAAGLSLAVPRRAEAAVLDKASFVFPDNGPNGEPDPAVWTRSGTIAPQAVPGVGLVISDPDNSASLLYTRDESTVLSAIQSNRTVTFKAKVRTPPIDDASNAWSGDAVGFRLILDDGQRRAELIFARDPNTRARILKVNSASAAFLAFNWDNNELNTYELARDKDGKVMLNATNGVTGAISSKTFLATDLATSNGSALLAWGVGSEGAGAFVFTEVQGEVDSVEVNFAAFMVTGLQVRARNQNDKILDKDEFEVKGSFTLGDGSDGIDILTEIVSLELSGGSGGFSTSIPAGSFRMDKKGRFKFETIIDVGVFEAVIRPLGGNTFEFKAEGEGFNLGAIANPVKVSLTIGDDGGRTEVLAEIEM